MSRNNIIGLRRHLLPNSKHGATKVVMVAATDHGEGGTTTAAILASTLARSGNSKILLVDANLRTPALDEVFEPGQGHKLMGLSDKVLSEAPLDQTIYQTDIPNLSFMPCGKAVTSPSYMFDSEPIVAMLSALREKFDFIIFDGSPLRDYSESSFLAGKMDGVILVVEAERTKIEVAQKIRKDLESTGVHDTGSSFEQETELHPGIPRTFPIVRRIHLPHHRVRRAAAPQPKELDITTEHTKSTKDSKIYYDFDFLLRALCRVLRGDIWFLVIDATFDRHGFAQAAKTSDIIEYAEQNFGIRIFQPQIPQSL